MRRQVRRAELLVGGDGGLGHRAGPRVDLRIGDTGRAQHVARDRGVGPARRLDLHPVELDAVHRAGRPAQRGGMRAGGAQQQRAVDVPEQEERAQRRNETSALSFWANATMSLAVFSTSSSCTISTGECM